MKHRSGPTGEGRTHRSLGRSSVAALRWGGVRIVYSYATICGSFICGVPASSGNRA